MDSMTYSAPSIREGWVVKLIANLKPFFRGTFQNFSSPPPNIASTRVSKIRGVYRFYFTYFPTSSFSGIYKRRLLSLPLGEGRGGARKALPALQRGPPCIATGLPLHHNNGPVADQGGPYGRKTRLFPVIFRRSKINKIHVPEKPGGPYGTPAPSIRVKKRAGNHRDRCQNGPKMSKNERFSEQDFVRKSIISMLQQLVYILNTETQSYVVLCVSVSLCSKNLL